MLLSVEDKNTFMKWLQNEITSNKELIEQMKKINTVPALVEIYESKTKACEIVLRMLSDTEKMVL